MPDLKVETKALLSDARVWHQASEDLAEPTAGIGPLTLNGPDDVMGMGARMGVDRSYESMRQQVLDLLNQATDYFDDLAGTLIDVGQAYVDQDSKTSDQLRKLETKLVEEP